LPGGAEACREGEKTTLVVVVKSTLFPIIHRLVSINLFAPVSGLEVRMTHIIGEPCIGTKDTACVGVCPVDCIHPTKDDEDFEEEEMLYIDPDTCIDCGLCVDECPVKAIFPEEDLPEEWQSFTARNAEYYAKKNA
jgi:ferredoxin